MKRPRRLQSAAVDGATLTLTYNEDLDTGITLPASAFVVTVGDATRSLDSVSVSGSAVTLTLATAVESGDTVTVDYTVPTGESANKLQDASGNAAESFSGQAVTNNTASSGTGGSVTGARRPASPGSLQVASHGSGQLTGILERPRFRARSHRVHRPVEAVRGPTGRTQSGVSETQCHRDLSRHHDPDRRRWGTPSGSSPTMVMQVASPTVEVTATPQGDIAANSHRRPRWTGPR